MSETQLVRFTARRLLDLDAGTAVTANDVFLMQPAGGGNPVKVSADLLQAFVAAQIGTIDGATIQSLLDGKADTATVTANAADIAALSTLAATLQSDITALGGAQAATDTALTALSGELDALGAALRITGGNLELLNDAGQVIGTVDLGAFVDARTPSTPAATAPGQIQTFTLTPQPGGFDVALTPPSDGGAAITTYTVQYRVDGTLGAYTSVSQPAASGTTISVTGADDATDYEVIVFATNSVGDGQASAPQTVSTPALVPSGLGTLSTTDVQSDSVTLSIPTPSSDGGAPITSRTIYRSTDNTSFTELGATTQTTFTDGTVVGGTTYFYAYTATNSVGESARSGSISVSVPAAAVPLQHTDIASLQEWWSIADSATVTESGGAISAVANKVAGGGALTQPTAANQPDISAVQSNSRDTATFERDRSEHLLTGATTFRNGASLFADAGESWAAMLVYRPNFPNSTAFAKGGEFFGSRVIGLRQGNIAQIQLNLRGINTEIISDYRTLLASDQSLLVLMVRWDGTRARVDLVGDTGTPISIADVPVGTATNSADEFIVGGRSDIATGGEPFTGLLSELLIYNEDLTDQQAADVIQLANFEANGVGSAPTGGAPQANQIEQVDGDDPTTIAQFSFVMGMHPDSLRTS